MNAKKVSHFYHALFNYFLSHDEQVRWEPGKAFRLKRNIKIKRPTLADLVEKKQRKQVTSKKLLIARRTSRIISRVPTVMLVAVTGSCAMDNANEDSDIDLLVVTKSNTLWSTRFVCYIALIALGVALRKPKDPNEKDKICLNLWLSESTMFVKKSRQNPYTAHELVQIIPLFERVGTYRKLLEINLWTMDFWPNSIQLKKIEHRDENRYIDAIIYLLLRALNDLAYFVQFNYMRHKITKESVSKSFAYFHPLDWGAKITKKLRKAGITWK